MKFALKLVAILIILVLFVTACDASCNQNTSNSPSGTITNKSEPEKNVVNFNENFILKKEPKSVTSDDIFTTDIEKTYLVRSKNGIYSEIVSSNSSGWIPEWYVKNNIAKFEKIDNKTMVINTATKLYLAPEAAQELTDEYGLKKGQCVKVKRKYLDWYNVEFVLYDAANTGDRWIKSINAIAFDPKECKEGRVKKGSLIYDDQFVEKKGDNDDGGIVFIINSLQKPNSKEIYYQVTGPGGFSGLIKQKDFLADPFISR